MMIMRSLTEELKQKVHEDNKAIIIYGPRQVGKTTLVKNLIADLPYKTLLVDGDQQKYIDVLSSKDLIKLKSLIAGYDLLFIDEAQKIPDIGLNLKILIDHLPELKIIATGSSSFDLANKVSEPLTGRAWNYTLYPISYLELSQIYNEFELKSQLEERLIYGSYPEIFSILNVQTKRDYLEQLSNAYLYKDILELASIKQSAKIRELLKLLAFQIGNEVSMNELANTLGISKGTVEHYIDLLEKSFVVFRLSGFSRNLRKEITKMPKIYFYDLGIRNILIDNVKSLGDRNDVGQLWENFLMIERLKFLRYNKILATEYFWRTYTGAELDYIEERDSKLFGYEFKYGHKTARAPQSWLSTYKNAVFGIINIDNFINFTTKFPL